jgi:hypothetical protein
MMSFESFVRLGWSFARVMARKLGPRRPQLPVFVEQYARDGIVLFEPGDRAVLDGASRCLACGRCDIRALLDDAFNALSPRGPMAFVLGVSRHSGAHDAAAITPAATPTHLAALTAVCPVDVPFAPLAALVRRRQRALQQVRARPAGGPLPAGAASLPRGTGVHEERPARDPLHPGVPGGVEPDTPAAE